MDRNFNCSFCSQVAVQCCLCATPRVYLCSQCLNQHTSKGLFHPLAPAFVPSSVTFATLPDYMNKFEATEKYKAAMNELKNRLDNEKLSASSFITAAYTEKSQELLAAYSTLHETVMSFYDKLKHQVNELQAELEYWIQCQCPLSQECLKMLRSGCHFRTNVEILQKTHYEIGPLQIANATIQTDQHITSLLEGRDFRCDCGDCEATANRLIPDLWWKCLQCGGDLKAEKCCVKCSHDKPEKANLLPLLPLEYPTDEGHECLSCRVNYSDSTYTHECSRGVLCLWCVAKKILSRSDIDKCPDCGKHILEIIYPWQLEIFCESCNCARSLSDFSHRVRCGSHVICSLCVLRQLNITNGYFSCRICPSSQQLPTAPCIQSGCLSFSSREVHSSRSIHPLCWLCAMGTMNLMHETCSCGKPLADKLKEAMCMRANSICSVCHSFRPLVPLCNCDKRVCARCVMEVKDKRLRLIEKFPESDERKCVGCLRVKDPDVKLSCGHYYHIRCFMRAGQCELCLKIKIYNS